MQDLIVEEDDDQSYQSNGDEESKENKEMVLPEFHAWEAISLMRRYSTLDFVIKDESDLMALIHVVGRRVYT